MKEQRHFTRIPFEGDVSIQNAAGQWSGRLLDISLHGLLMERPAGWKGKNGDLCQLILPLQGDISIDSQSEVAHVHADVIGFKFDQLDLDSATHLRRLVELNLGDENLLERELNELIQIHATDDPAPR